MGGWRTFICCGLAALLPGCGSTMSPSNVPPRRDINAVLADETPEWMALPGVEGVYVGVLEDGVTPCLRIMLARDDPNLAQSLPKSVDGYRVLIEVSGKIRPLRSNTP